MLQELCRKMRKIGGKGSKELIDKCLPLADKARLVPTK